MNTSHCPHCGSDHYWDWEEAFDKFGFGDGDGLVETNTVAKALRAAGFTVTVSRYGCHNRVVTSIKQDGRQLIPDTANVGYDDPRGYLPDSVIALLDTSFGDAAVADDDQHDDDVAGESEVHS